MKRAVITNDDHWVVIDGIRYLRGDISPIEPVLTTGVKIRGDNVNPMVIAVDGTTVNDVAVTSQAELIEWFEQNSFKIQASVGNGDTTEQVSVSGSTWSFSDSGHYSYTGSGATKVLPQLATGTTYFIKNRGTGNLIITGSLYLNSEVDSIEISTGEAIILHYDGEFWTVQ